MHIDRRGDGSWHPAFEGRHGRQRVLDPAPARLRREAVDARGLELDLRGLLRREAALVRDGDVRHRVDELADEIVLRSLHEGSHHDGETDAGGDAGNGHQRLPRAAADMRQRDV